MAEEKEDKGIEIDDKGNLSSATSDPALTPEPGDKVTAEEVASAATSNSPPPRKDWRQEQMEKRIGKLTADKKNLEDRLRAFEASSTGSTSNDDRLPITEIDRRAEVRARELAAEQSFVNEAQRVAAEGERTFSDFGAKINSLAAVKTHGDPESERAYVQMVRIAIETGEGPKVLYTLGSDPNEAARILSLSPTKQAIELAKLASKAPPNETSAPRPITPLGNRGGTHTEISPDDSDRADKLSTKEWMKRRNKQIAEQKAEEQQRYGRQ